MKRFLILLLSVLIVLGCDSSNTPNISYNQEVYTETRPIIILIEYGEKACAGIGGYTKPFDPDKITMCIRGDHPNVQDVEDHEFLHLRDTIFKRPPSENIIKLPPNPHSKELERFQ